MICNFRYKSINGVICHFYCEKLGNFRVLANFLFLCSIISWCSWVCDDPICIIKLLDSEISFFPIRREKIGIVILHLKKSFNSAWRMLWSHSWNHMYKLAKTQQNTHEVIIKSKVGAFSVTGYDMMNSPVKTNQEKYVLKSLTLLLK